LRAAAILLYCHRMGPTRILLAGLLLVACSQPTPSSTNTPALRATSGPTNVPQPIKVPPDRDGDRVYDYADQCPDQAGSLRDGCPYTDTDRDGISDKYDKCPTAPEPRHGHADKDGCPIAPPPAAAPPPATAPPAATPATPATPPATTPATPPPAAPPPAGSPPAAAPG
jgi:hypothetical protein